MNKIAIKAEKWADMKPAVDLLRSVGQTVVKRKDEHKEANFNILCNGIPWPIIKSQSNGNQWQYASKTVDLSQYPSMLVLTMPQDMPKLKEALGIEVPKKPLKRIILNQYEAVEILVDEFEMVHNNGTLLLLPK